MEYNFIKTSDPETKDKLLKENFKLVSHDGNMYTFLNDKHVKFSNSDKKITYSNMLCI